MDEDEFATFRANFDQLGAMIKEWVIVFSGLRDALVAANFSEATADQIVIEYSRHAFAPEDEE